MTPQIRTIRRNPRRAPFPQLRQHARAEAVDHAEFRRTPAEMPSPTRAPAVAPRQGRDNPGEPPRREGVNDAGAALGTGGTPRACGPVDRNRGDVTATPAAPSPEPLLGTRPGDPQTPPRRPDAIVREFCGILRSPPRDHRHRR